MYVVGLLSIDKGKSKVEQIRGKKRKSKKWPQRGLKVNKATKESGS